MRSVVVVFPASMWAMMPMFRVLSSATVRAINPESSLPAIMGKSLVGLGHAMRVVFFLDRIAAIVRGVDQFACQLFLHRLFAARTRIQKQPTNAERGASRRSHLDRNLIRRPADAPGFHFQHRLHVFHGLL